MTEMQDKLEEQNKLLRLLSKLTLDQNLQDKSEAEKAQYLSEYGMSNREIAEVLGKDESTISRQVS